MSARRLALGILVTLCAAAGGRLVSAVPPAGAVSLPDGRVYEMVTPIQNEDAEAYVQTSNLVENSEHGVPTDLPFQAAAGGEAVAYAGGPSSGGSGNAGQGGGNEYLAVRSATGGWTQVDLQPPGLETAVYEAFSSNLSVGILDAGYRESAPLLPEAPSGGYDVLYARENASGSYRPFFTTTPSHRSTNEFQTYEGLGELQGRLSYAGSSTDLSHLLFQANDALTAGAPDGGAEENNLYDSVEGQLQLVNVLPNGDTEPNASFGAPRFPEGQGGEERHDTPDFSRAISADGSRIFWTDLNTGDLYVRENDTQPPSPLGGKGECTVPTDACTVQVDSSVGGGGRFWTASVDGGKVIFTKGDLYEYEVANGTTTDLASGGEVEGVVGASEDGEYVYFVGRGMLASGATAGQSNLYMYHGGVTTFIATLLAPNGFNEGDNGLPPFTVSGAGHFGDWQPGVGHRTAEVTPDGQSLVFMSRQSLTGYENKDQTEVYDYDADTGQLVCVSCDPSGAPPPNLDKSAAGYLPIGATNTYQPRVISEDGSRVFFNSDEPLVPQDSNGRVDVYEWERDSTNGCQQSVGCISLLSGGTSSDNSYFFDASSSGDDVFIETRAQLVPQDGNENFNVYDVRADGVRALSPPVCSGTGCQGVPAAPPIFATPSSVTFNGIGNLAAQPKMTVKPKKLKSKAKKKKPKKKHKGKGRKAIRPAKRAGKSDRRGK